MVKKKDNLAGNKVSVSTQQYLDIAEIKDDVVVMRDGTMRAVLMVASINFALKSEDEQNAIVSAYVGFLNSISYPLQIVIQSREMNIEKYLADLHQKYNEQTNQLLKIQTGEYIQYIEELIKIGKIMNKRFYVIIPYDPLSDSAKGFFNRLGNLFRPAVAIKMKGSRFVRRKSNLTRRVEAVMSGLSSIGLKSVQLDTQSLIELYYNTYNPRTSENEKLAPIEKIRLEKDE